MLAAPVVAAGWRSAAWRRPRTPRSPRPRRSSCADRAFGLLAVVQSVGNLATSAVAGLLWTLATPSVAFGYLAAWMLAALLALIGVSLRRA